MDPSTSERFSVSVRKIADEVFGSKSQETLRALTSPVSKYFVRANTNMITPGELKRRLNDRGIITDQHPIIEEALCFPVAGPFDVPEYPRDIVVDKKTAESVLQGANVYAPGIIECNSMREGDEVSVRSEFGELLASGKTLMNATEVLTFRRGLAVQICNRRFTAVQIRELPEFQAGLLYPQSLAAMTTSRILDPKPGETIVDMNCAPGGKLSHLSQLMENSGKLYGFDRNHEKISQTRKVISHLRCRNVVLLIHDSRYLHDDMPSLGADKVLIDPPCSALGLRPKIYDFSKSERIKSLSSYQMQFISAASRIVKPGGTIVYSVCTFSSEECEQIVDKAASDLNLKVVEQNPIVGERGLPSFNSGRLCQRFNPGTNEIGYFIAKFQT